MVRVRLAVRPFTWRRIVLKQKAVVEKRIAYEMEAGPMRKLTNGGSTNVRLFELVWTRSTSSGGDGTMQEKEKMPKPKITNKWGRRDLMVSLKGLGRVKWYHLCWFHLSGQRRYATWQAFRMRDGLEVDHGCNCTDPLIVDHRLLNLKRKTGANGNAAQGGSIRKQLRALAIFRKPAAACTFKSNSMATSRKTSLLSNPQS